jgi:Tol biopolymer transport system component
VGETRLVAGPGGDHHPAVSPDGKWIAWQRRNNEISAGWSIWIASASGANPKELGAGRWPAFSPDNKRIVFGVTDFNGNDQLWVMHPDGSKRTQLTDEGRNTTPAWHPSGKKLVYSSDRTGNLDVWELDTTSGTETQLTTYPGVDTSPVYSPDGKSIVYVASTDDGMGIFTMRLER